MELLPYDKQHDVSTTKRRMDDARTCNVWVNSGGMLTRMDDFVLKLFSASLGKICASFVVAVMKDCNGLLL